MTKIQELENKFDAVFEWLNEPGENIKKNLVVGVFFTLIVLGCALAST